MTNDNKYHERVMSLADDLVEDLLKTSDQELIKEVEEQHSADDIVTSMKSIFEKSCNHVGLQRLEKARLESSNNKKNQPILKPVVDPNFARKRIKEVFDNNKTDDQYTMAARNAEELSDNDIVGLYNRMLKLNIISSNSNGDSNE